MYSSGFTRVNPKPAYMLPSRLLKMLAPTDADMLSPTNNMPWGRIVLAAFVAGIAASMTDWLFMGDWLYKRYDRHPEIWRVSAQTETKAILWASLLPFLTCGAFALTYAGLRLRSLSAALLLAVAVWLIAALPLLVVNALFIKISPTITTSYALGWLVKLVLAAVAIALIVR
jgi:hypothetical protein